MSDTVTIPAPGADKPADTPASEVKTPAAGKTELAPQADKPAGKDEQQTALKPEGETQEKPDDAESRRKQRNRERWQNMKREHSEALERARRAEAEVAKIRTAKPDYSQYTDPGEELAARTANHIRSQQVGDYERQAQEDRARADRAMAEAWHMHRVEMSEQHPDFDAKVAQTPIHDRAIPFIVNSENGGEVAYWLANNLEKAAQLKVQFETDPASALIELGRIEARLTVPEAKRVSAAPKPAATLAGGSSPMGFDPRSASVDDFAAQLKKAKLIR